MPDQKPNENRVDHATKVEAEKVLEKPLGYPKAAPDASVGTDEQAKSADSINK